MQTFFTGMWILLNLYMNLGRTKVFTMLISFISGV